MQITPFQFDIWLQNTINRVKYICSQYGMKINYTNTKKLIKLGTNVRFRQLLRIKAAHRVCDLLCAVNCTNYKWRGNKKNWISAGRILQQNKHYIILRIMQETVEGKREIERVMISWLQNIINCTELWQK